MMHRWSGWPGAYCLDCGAEDQAEVCLATHDALQYYCSICRDPWPQEPCKMAFDGKHNVVEVTCYEHVNRPCEYRQG